LITGSAAVGAYTALPKGDAVAQGLLLLGVSNNKPVAGGTQTTTWDLTQGLWTNNGATAPAATASNGNKTAVLTGDSGQQCTRVLTGSDLSASLKQFWQWRFDLLNAGDTTMIMGFSSGGIDAEIGNFGSPAQSAGIRSSGAQIGGFPVNGNVAVPAQNYAQGNVWDCAFDGPHQMYWISPDGVNWWGSGLVAGSPSSNTHGDFLNGGRSIPALSTVHGGLSPTITILAGTNITRSPPTGYTVLP
jgi:hypothetical protein